MLLMVRLIMLWFYNRDGVSPFLELCVAYAPTAQAPPWKKALNQSTKMPKWVIEKHTIFGGTGSISTNLRDILAISEMAWSLAHGASLSSSSYAAWNASCQKLLSFRRGLCMYISHIWRTTFSLASISCHPNHSDIQNQFQPQIQLHYV